MGKGFKRAAIAVLAAAFALCVSGCASIMDERESFASDDLEKLVNMAKAPDTFVLRGDVIVISADSEADYPGEYTYIEYSSANSYGTPLRGVAMFKDHRYIGDLNDEVEKPQSDVSDEETDNLIEIGETQLVYLGWNLGGREDTDHVKARIINGRKLAFNLGVEFAEAK